MDFNFSKPIDYEKEKRKKVIYQLDSSLWTGMFIGAGLTLSVGGLLQFFQPYFDEKLQEISHRIWFNVPVWVWMISLSFFILLFIYNKKKNSKKIK